MKSDESVACIVFGCELVAGDLLIFRVEELQLVYAVCGFHSCDLRRGSFFAAPEHANRGFIGLKVVD